jgi:hypothetical protein
MSVLRGNGEVINMMQLEYFTANGYGCIFNAVGTSKFGILKYRGRFFPARKFGGDPGELLQFELLTPKPLRRDLARDFAHHAADTVIFP